MHSTVAKCLELDPAEKHVLAKFDQRLREAVVALMIDARAGGLDAEKLDHLSASVLLTVAADIALRVCGEECTDERFTLSCLDALRWSKGKRAVWRAANGDD
jgi:hypothetical protein